MNREIDGQMSQNINMRKWNMEGKPEKKRSRRMDESRKEWTRVWRRQEVWKEKGTNERKLQRECERAVKVI